MCRIAGFIDKSCADLSATITAMRDSMAHGGPDNGANYIDGNISLALGHRRLSIIDLSACGNQPMFSSNGNLAIVFNGEIYNYLDLKNELIQSGFQFKTESDTEVILASYQCWGKKSFARLKGMFAFALYDKEKNELILVRDPSGIKPLYYYISDTSLYFASEIRAFKSLKKWHENPDWKIFFLTYGFLPEPITTLQDVKPLQNGSYCSVNVNTLRASISSYTSDVYANVITDKMTAVKLIRETLDKAVERHLISDAPIGLFLSGGIDSSLLTLIAKRVGTSELNTLSITFDDATFSEEPFQNIIAEKTASHHRAFKLTKEMYLEALPDILMAMDQPTADGVNTYFICKFAKQYGLKAVLSGLGADELFGGYASFYRNEIVDRFSALPSAILKASQLLPKDRYKKVSFLSRKDAIGLYLFNRGFFNTSETAQLLDADTSEVKEKLDQITVPHFVDKLEYGNKISYLERYMYMQGQLLKDTDMMSMWHSIEVRVPFLDIDLVNLMNSISPVLKFENSKPKGLLIDSYNDLLPREIWDRKKQGFVFPFQKWMNGSETHVFKNTNNKMTDRYKSGKLNWSRYWTYLIASA